SIYIDGNIKNFWDVIKMLPYNDYKNPIVWGINTFSFVLGIVGYVIAGSSDNHGISNSAGIITLAVMVASWMIMWEIYERTGGFKKRYKDPQNR
ncbi:MAG: hypothetical protein GW795_11010, partial [Cyanobacteria bacterium]|nr:hypothetical protein [Cyanobacteria bacterium CG_2015-04_32_10]